MLVVGLLKDDASSNRNDLEQRFSGLGNALEQQEFKGKSGEQVVFNLLAEQGPRRLVVLGLGDPESFSLNGLRTAAAKAAKAASGCTGSLGLQLPWDGLEPSAAAAAAAEAVRLAVYVDQRFRKEPEPQRLPEALELIGLPAAAAAGLAAVSAA